MQLKITKFQNIEYQNVEHIADRISHPTLKANIKYGFTAIKACNIGTWFYFSYVSVIDMENKVVIDMENKIQNLTTHNTEISQNGQTHSNNLSANCLRIV